MCTCHTLFCTFLCHCIAPLRRKTFLVTHFLWMNCWMCSPKILLLVVLFAFIFSLLLIFTFLAAGISHFLIAAMKFPCCSSNKICLLFFHHSLFLCYPLESKHQKYPRKRLDFVVVFSNSPCSHAISCQIKPWVAFGLPYLMIELFHVGVRVE